MPDVLDACALSRRQRRGSELAPSLTRDVKSKVLEIEATQELQACGRFDLPVVCLNCQLGAA